MREAEPPAAFGPAQSGRPCSRRPPASAARCPGAPPPWSTAAAAPSEPLRRPPARLSPRPRDPRFTNFTNFAHNPPPPPPLPPSPSPSPSPSPPLPLSLSLSPSPLSLSLSPFPSLPLPLSLSLSPSLSPFPSLPLPLSLSLSPSPSLPLPLSLSLSPFPSLPFPLPLSLSLSQQHSQPPPPQASTASSGAPLLTSFAWRAPRLRASRGAGSGEWAPRRERGGPARCLRSLSAGGLAAPRPAGLRAATSSLSPADSLCGTSCCPSSCDPLPVSGACARQPVPLPPGKLLLLSPATQRLRAGLSTCGWPAAPSSHDLSSRGSFASRFRKQFAPPRDAGEPDQLRSLARRMATFKQ